MWKCAIQVFENPQSLFHHLKKNFKSGFGVYLTLTENWLSQEHYLKEKKLTIICLFFGSLLTWHFIKSQIIMKIDGSK